LDFFFLIARFSALIIFDSSSESLAIGLNLGTQVSHAHKVSMLGKVNEDPATLADQSNIGGPTVHLSATSQLRKQRPETEFVNDEYFVYNVENSDNSDHIEKCTHETRLMD
jgi:hypothetical protein